MTDPQLEDFRPGQRLTSPPVTMTEAETLAFAQEFDPQPMHVDAAWAASGPLGGLIASGWHTATVALQLQAAAGLPRIGLTGIASIAWPLPVRPGDILHAEIEITQVESGLVHFQNRMVNADDQTVQIIVGAVLVAPRDG